MKHIKKYRGLLKKGEQEKLRSQARQRAKQVLSKKYKKEYDHLKVYSFNKLRREYLKKPSIAEKLCK